MKTLVRLLMLAAVCASFLPHGMAEEKKVEVKLGLMPYAEPREGKFLEWVIVMGGLAYRNVGELKQAIARLPKGTEVVWDPGCCRVGGEPLFEPGVQADLEKECEKAGVTLRVIPAG